MAKFIFNAKIIVEGDAIETRADAISEIEIMLNDYEDMNPYCNSIIITIDKKED